jgi:Fe-S cluster assembly protein SufD
MNEATVDIQTAQTQPASGAQRRDAVTQFADYYRKAAELLPGGHLPKVRAWRDAAMAAFNAMGMPHRRVEEWKYTNLRSLMPDIAPPSLVSVERELGTGDDHGETYRAVFVGGGFRADLSNIQDAPGVGFRALSDALSHERSAAQAIDVLAVPERNVIAALATAFAMDGMLISIAPGTKLAKPLVLVSIGAGRSPGLIATADVIHIGDGAELTLIENHSTMQADQLFFTRHMRIGVGAKVKHVRIVNGGAAKHLATMSVELGAGAEYDPVHFVEGGALTRIEGNIRLAGEGARCHLNGAMLLRGREHADITLVVDHAVPSCESRETVKAVLDGEARGVFQAKVIVRPGAQKTDGRQLANGLLLSETAEFDAKPELEIYADDVKCNHGATSGALDDDMLFYLRSRGIPEAEAKSLLVLAFVGEIIDQISDEELHATLMARASQWLASAGTKDGYARG